MLQQYFDDFGHKCDLNFNHWFDKVKVNKSRARVWFMRNSIISQHLILLRSRPRSFAALRNEILYQLEHYPYALHPFSYITFYCELIWMIVVFVTLVILPFEVFKYTNESFKSNFSDQYLLMVLSTICIFDCVRRFFTGYLIKHDDRDEIVLDFRRISINYIKTYFFIDSLSSLATFLELFFFVSPSYHVPYESMAYLKFVRLGSMLRVLQNALHFHRFSQITINSIVDIIRLCFIVHWVACFSVLAANIERYFYATNKQWIDYIFLPNTSLSDKYIDCLHRSTSILTGTGYRFNSTIEKKLMPRAVNDLLYTIFTAALGHILSLVIIGKVYEMIQGMRGSSAANEAMINEVSQYIKHHRLIQETTQNKIKTFYDYKYGHSFFKESAILGTIPILLRQKILLNSAKLVLENVELFKQLPAPVVANLILHLGRDIILSGDVVYHCGDGDNSIYFIESGTIAVFGCTGREIAHYEDGSYFGHVSTENAVTYRHSATIVALETCELFELKTKDYYALMEFCPGLVYEMESVLHARYEKAMTLMERYENLLNKELKLNQRDKPTISANF